MGGWESGWEGGVNWGVKFDESSSRDFNRFSAINRLTTGLIGLIGLKMELRIFIYAASLYREREKSIETMLGGDALSCTWQTSGNDVSLRDSWGFFWDSFRNI